MMNYICKYKTPDGFDDLVMRGDGEALTGLWFEGSRDDRREAGGCERRETDAKDVNGRYSIKTTIHEQLAKIAAVLDVMLCAPAHLESFPEWLTVLLVLCILHVVLGECPAWKNK